MAIVDTGGIRLHVQRMSPRDGRAPVATAVLVHGLLTDSLASYYFTVAPAFTAAGIDAVMYDLRGHGRSERPPSGYTLDHHINDLETLLDRLDITGPVHLVGNSYGGTIAFGWASRHPKQVASLTLIESNPPTTTWTAKIGEILDRVMTELVYDKPDVNSWITANRSHNPTRLLKEAARLARETTISRDVPSSRVLTQNEIRSVRCPVLGIYGGNSNIVELARLKHTLLADFRSVVLPGHGHSVLVEAAGTVGGHVLDLIRSTAAEAVL
jgi:pimeloyl-ACP methyl ester carboxylesterase